MAIISGYVQSVCHVVPQNTCYTINKSTVLFFNCSCDTIGRWYLFWNAYTPLHRYQNELFVDKNSIAGLPFIGLYSGAENYYILDGMNLIVKNPNYSNAGKYKCEYQRSTLTQGNRYGDWSAEAIVLGKCRSLVVSYDTVSWQLVSYARFLHLLQECHLKVCVIL